VTAEAEDPSLDQLAQLKIDLWAARDAAIGAEAAAGQLRAQLRATESELDDRRRHVEALLREVEQLRARIVDLEAVQAHRDALLRSPTWRIGTLIMRPVQAARRRPQP
jgi:hypothetical protein